MPSPSRNALTINPTTSDNNVLRTNRLSRLPQHVKSGDSSPQIVVR